MKYIMLLIILSVFVFFLILLFSDLRESLRSAIKSIPPDHRTPSQRKKKRESNPEKQTSNESKKTKDKNSRRTVKTFSDIRKSKIAVSKTNRKQKEIKKKR